MATIWQFDEIPECFYRGASEEVITACNICGAPLNSPNELGSEPTRTALYWTSRAILLSDDSLDFTTTFLEGLPVELLARDRAITRLPAEPLAWSCFRITDGDRKGKVIAANFADGDWHAEVYFPVHEACVQIIDRFLDTGLTAPPPFVGQWTMSKIWDVLRLRVEADKSHRETSYYPVGLYELYPPHGYYIDREDRHCLHNPLDTDRYTSKLLEHLTVLPDLRSGSPPERAVARLRQGFEKLPRELQDKIIDCMAPLNPVPIACNRTLSPATWRRMLCHRSCFPFLWDIDISAIDAYADREGPALDYELLFRQLAQPDVFNKGQPLQDISHALHNRRRIWRVLQNMRAGDTPREDNLPLSIFRRDEGSQEL